MDVINKVDQKLVDRVEDEFADSLKQYNLRFIGRGKHLRQAQLDIVSNTDLIKKNTDSLLSLIDNVDFKLDNFMRETNRRVSKRVWSRLYYFKIWFTLWTKS